MRTQKLEIKQNNKNKSGVYRWRNLLNGKCYIGSSVNLGLRFKSYYNISFLEKETKKNSSMIYKALLKYGYSNFSLEILEFCEASEAVAREQHYMDIVKPEYNIFKIAGSSLGKKHSEETLAKLKGRTWTLTAEQIARLKSRTPTTKQLEGFKIYNTSKAQRIELLDTLKNETTVYSSIAEAARSIGCSHSNIRSALKHLQEKGVSRLIKKRYLVKIIND